MNRTFERSCAAKTKFYSRKMAKIMVKRVRRAADYQPPANHRLEAYHCDWCGGWHIGHRRKGA